MAKKDDPYFRPIETETQTTSLKHAEPLSAADPYFAPLDESTPLTIPDSIEAESSVEASNGYKFIQDGTPKRKTVRRLFFAVAGFLGFTALWQAYNIFMDIMSVSATLGSIFGVLFLVLIQLIVKEGYQFRKGQLQFAKVEGLREQAEVFINERSHGKSATFIDELTELYSNKPQQPYLRQAIEQLPDYLNDAEIISRLSADFLCHLDEEAKRLVTRESISTASTVAVSQVAIVDSLIVLWKTLTMVNKINTIYGLSLTRLGQWQLFIRIIKASLLSAGSQVGISSVVHKMAPGVTGTVLGSVAQGLGVGTYVARIGVEAIKQTRPIAFEEDQALDVNLIRDGISQALIRLTDKDKGEDA